jgi:hypothetical protein
MQIILASDNNYQLWVGNMLVWTGITYADAVAVRNTIAGKN